MADYSNILRGIYDFEHEPEYWKEAISQFPNHVPRFDEKTQAESFIRQYCQKQSNPEDTGLQHSISTLTSWSQIEKYIFSVTKNYNGCYDDTQIANSMVNNRFHLKEGSEESSNPVGEYLASRLNLAIHAKLSSISVMNTFRYLYEHMRCGIYCMIRGGRLVIFCPFVNKDYQNNWSEYLHLDCDDNQLESYYKRKSSHFRHENYIDKKLWWANGNIICNEFNKGRNQWWGDQFLFQIKDMIAETCNHRDVPDCEFFVNKRDYPQLKYNLEKSRVVEPYGFIYDKDDREPEEDVHLTRHLYKSYAPILSFYSSERFADIPFPPSEDWEAATGLVFPSSFSHSFDDNKNLIVGSSRDLFTSANLKKFERPWEEKVPVAFFRGTATGGGVTVETNQRLRLAMLSYEWSKLPRLNDPHPYLDAKITGWNLRDKKIATGKMTFLVKSNFPFEGDRAKNFVPIYEQSKYKYVLYVEGHCAACRYGFMMQLGSVILKVESTCVADKMWYFPLLRPFVDHVPVKADLSDLEEKIAWCRDHDTECREIVSNARQLYDQYISREGILDYMQAIFVNISKRFLPDPEWSTVCPSSRPRPTFASTFPDGKTRVCVKVGVS